MAQVRLLHRQLLGEYTLGSGSLGAPTVNIPPLQSNLTRQWQKQGVIIGGRSESTFYHTINRLRTRQRTFTVDAANPAYVSSGLTVRNGDAIIVHAAENSVSFGFVVIVPPIFTPIYSFVEGGYFAYLTPTHAYQPLFATTSAPPGAVFTAPGLNPWSLALGIRDSELGPPPIGDVVDMSQPRRDFAIPRRTTGPFGAQLWFVFNDDVSGYFDNSGLWEVTVTLIPPL